MTLTVGELRTVLANLPDDLPVVIPGGEYDYQEAEYAKVLKDVLWMDYDEDSDEHTEPVERTLLVIDQ